VESVSSTGVKVNELKAASWRILVGKEFQRKGAAELKERYTRLKFDRWPAKSDD